MRGWLRIAITNQRSSSDELHKRLDSLRVLSYIKNLSPLLLGLGLGVRLARTHYDVRLEERKAKAAEKKAEEARIKVRKAAAKVKRDRENEEKKERLKKAQEDMDRAEELAKETADIAAEGLKIANARAREKAEQAKKADEEVAAYASTFTLFQGIQREVNRIAEEHGALWDKVMSLHKSNVTPAHRQIIWDAFKLAATRCDNLGNKLEVTLSGKLKKEKK